MFLSVCAQCIFFMYYIFIKNILFFAKMYYIKKCPIFLKFQLEVLFYELKFQHLYSHLVRVRKGRYLSTHFNKVQKNNIFRITSTSGVTIPNLENFAIKKSSLKRPLNMPKQAVKFGMVV